MWVNLGSLKYSLGHLSTWIGFCECNICSNALVATPISQRKFGLEPLLSFFSRIGFAWTAVPREWETIIAKKTPFNHSLYVMSCIKCVLCLYVCTFCCQFFRNRWKQCRHPASFSSTLSILFQQSCLENSWKWKAKVGEYCPAWTGDKAMRRGSTCKDITADYFWICSSIPSLSWKEIPLTNAGQ